MQRNIVSFIKEQLDFQCMLCAEQYDCERKEPIAICQSNHSVCKQCVTSHLFKSPIEKCPFCRVIILKTRIKPLPCSVLIKKIKSLLLLVNKKNNELLQKLRTTQEELIAYQSRVQTAIYNEKKLHHHYQTILSEIQAQMIKSDRINNQKIKNRSLSQISQQVNSQKYIILQKKFSFDLFQKSLIWSNNLKSSYLKTYKKQGRTSNTVLSKSKLPAWNDILLQMVGMQKVRNNYQSFQFGLMQEGFLLQNSQKKSWTLKIEKKQHGLIMIGLCLKNIIKKNKFNDKTINWENTGHGCYVIVSGGWCFSHSSPKFNNVFKSFKFSEGDVIYCEYDPIKWVMKWKKINQNMIFQMPVNPTPPDEAYHPFVGLYVPGDEVEITQP